MPQFGGKSKKTSSDSKRHFMGGSALPPVPPQAYFKYLKFS
jgi:hypothetical protein